MTGDALTSPTSSETAYFERPLAPAPLPVLAGVVALVSTLLLSVARIIASDWVAVFACMAVLATGAVLLDMSGRRAAASKPHQLYNSRRLPTEKSAFRTGLIVVTLVVLLVVVTATIDPNREASPFPYFLAAEFLFLVLPQLVARRVVRRAGSQ